MIITIDGPVASGKSSVAKELAKQLDMYYLYTGLLYRAVAYVLVTEKGENYAQDLSLAALTFVKDITYDYGKNGDARPCIFYKNEEISQHLYDRDLEEPASIVSANEHVRAALLEIQRNVARRYDIVADGRDCGSVVFPDAGYKFYLTADADIRAKRLFLDEKRKNLAKNLQVEKDGVRLVKEELERRDARDKGRTVSPLVVPEGGIVIDNSHLSQQETINKFLAIVKK